MRILQVIPFFSPKMGGSAQVAYQITRHLVERGHEVTVVTSDYGTKEAQFPEGLFKVVFHPSVLACCGFYPTPDLRAWSQANVRNFDVIHMHTVRTFQNAVVQHYAVRLQVPYVLSAHGTLPIIVQRQLLKQAYDRLIGKSLLESARFVMAVSTAETEQYRIAGVLGNRIRLIYNGLDINEFLNLPARGSFLRNFASINGKSKMILFLGRIHKRKGINYLIEAYSQLRLDRGDAFLVIVGPDDGELANLKALRDRLNLQEKVWFVGPLYGQDKLAAFIDADVLVSPAAHEIFGLVPFEALLCGTPVIVGDDCGTGQLFSESKSGYLVRNGDIQQLAKTILYVLNNPAAARQKVITGQEFIRLKMNWNQISLEIEKLYQDSVR
jgi:glycosyltransferase involved in cell wall biosynthesis